MSSPDLKFCRSRVAGKFALKAGDSVYHPPRHLHDFLQQFDHIEIFERSSRADHSATRV